MKKDYDYFKILVVEDNAGDFELINAYLRFQIKDLNLKNTTSFKDTEALLKSGNQRFDIILLDLSLPDLSGKELTKEIVSLAKDTPIIVLTGYKNLDFSIQSLSMGVSDYLLKDDISPDSLYKDIIYSIERKKSNIKIIESEKRYSDLFHFSPQPIIVYDTETLEILSVNEAALKSYGYTEKEILNSTINDLCFKPDDLELTNTNWFIENNHENFNGIFKCKRKDESYIDIEARSNVFNYRGKNARLVLLTDITDRLKYIKEIENQNKKLQDMAYTQSHIVRAPLARIMTIVSLLKELKIETPECSELLKHIIESGNELDEVIKTIVVKTENLNNRLA